MIIRKEEVNDYDEVYEVVKRAFETAEHSDGTEQDLVVKLRQCDAFVPELSLVAEINGTIVGYILFTKVEIGDTIQLALAPLAVLPEYQRKGIGQALIQAGHKKASELGYEYSVVLGSEQYYPKAGYEPASNYGIRPPFYVPSTNYMVCPLQENPRQITGGVIYSKPFGVDYD